MRKIRGIVVFVIAFTSVITSCGSFQDDTNIDDERNVAKGIGYLEDDVVFVNDKDGNEIKFEKKEDIIADFNDYENTEYPLLAKNEEEDIYIYEDKGSGTILVKGELVQYLDVGHDGIITPLGILPELHSGDFDDDNKNEVAIVLFVGSGTGISFEELYILDDDEGYEEIYKAYSLNNLEYTDLFHESIDYDIYNNDNVKMTIGDVEYNLNGITNLSELVLGNITYFKIDGNEINIYTKLGASITDMVSPQYDDLGWLEADVKFSEEGYVLNDVIYNEDTEYIPFDDKEVNYIR